ncbi:MAG TPA: hypothetical protein VF118_05225 [Gemmatimonadaceae bacterium]
MICTVYDTRLAVVSRKASSIRRVVPGRQAAPDQVAESTVRVPDRINFALIESGVSVPDPTVTLAATKVCGMAVWLS